MTDDTLWDEAIDLAIERGCVPEDDCWTTCLDRALEDLA